MIRVGKPLRGQVLSRSWIFFSDQTFSSRIRYLSTSETSWGILFLMGTVLKEINCLAGEKSPKMIPRELAIGSEEARRRTGRGGKVAPGSS